MIISASRRTDIPSFYSDWFYNRINEGYVCVRNPMNPRQISRISLSPDVVDGIVFWTKNPQPMISHLDRLKDYMYIFQFTVTPYGRDVEVNVPSKDKVIVPAFQALSDKIGPERVIWRYDPILLTEKYGIAYHTRYFEALARRISGCTEKCVISFMDMYKSTLSNTRDLNLCQMDGGAMRELAYRLANIAVRYNLRLETCAEKIDLSEFGICHSHCIDGALFERLLGCKLKLDRDKNQRPECGCAQSIDIGAYNTCQNGCKYCYANHSAALLTKNTAAHNPASPLLCGIIAEGETVREREIMSSRSKTALPSF